MEETEFQEARLEGALFYDANLKGARFAGWFGRENPHLEQADLGDADLRGTHLKGVLVDEHTAWPAEFGRRAAGVILAGGDAAASPPQQA
jgi:uncharacterized protein YjbI with pentapeptide repeats